jgi:cytochrome c-type biogenesis protein CcmH
MMVLSLAPLLAWMLWAAPAQAYVRPEERLPDPALERQAAALDRQLRCVTCAGQSISDSDAPLAEAMRRAVRQQLAAGQTSEDVLNSIRRTYGDDVLQSPPVNAQTAALWAGPALLLLTGLAMAWRHQRQAARDQQDSPPLPLQPPDA